MKFKKITFVSLLFAVIYFGASFVIFFGGLADPLSTSRIQTFFILPALLFFGAGFGSGNEAAIRTAIIVFFIIWLICFTVLLIVAYLRFKLRKPH